LAETVQYRFWAAREHMNEGRSDRRCLEAGEEFQPCTDGPGCPCEISRDGVQIAPARRSLVPSLVPSGISPGGNVLEQPSAKNLSADDCDAGRGGPDSDGWTLPAVTRR
jgi:hypothetical protein